jgi:hypothetical protein
LHETSYFPKIQPVLLEIIEFSMVEIVESNMDVVKLNKFVLKVLMVDAIVYCVEMELLPVVHVVVRKVFKRSNRLVHRGGIIISGHPCAK